MLGEEQSVSKTVSQSTGQNVIKDTKISVQLKKCRERQMHPVHYSLQCIHIQKALQQTNKTPSLEDIARFKFA